MNEGQRDVLRTLSPLPTLDLAVACLRCLPPLQLARMLVCGVPLASAVWAMPELVVAAPSPRFAAVACAALLLFGLVLRAWLAGGALGLLVARLLPLPAAPDARVGLSALAATGRGLPALIAFLGLAYLASMGSLWALFCLLPLWLARAARWPAPLARAVCRGMATPDSHLAPVLAGSSSRDGAGRRGSAALVELLLLLFTLLVALNFGGLALVLGGVLGLAPLSDSATLVPFPLRVFRDDPAWALALLPLAALCMEPLRIMVAALICVRRLALDGAEALSALDACAGPAASDPLPHGLDAERRRPVGPIVASLVTGLVGMALWLFVRRLVHAWSASSGVALGLQGDALPAFMEGASRSWPVAAAVSLYGVALFYVASLRTPPLCEPRPPALLTTLSFSPELALRARLYRATGLPAHVPAQSDGALEPRRSRLRFRRPQRPGRSRHKKRRPRRRPARGARSTPRREAGPVLPSAAASIRVAPSLTAMGTLSIVLPISVLMPPLLIPLAGILLAVLAAERARLRQRAPIVSLHGPRAFVVGQPGVLEARLRGPLTGCLSRLSIQVEFAGGARGPWTPCVPVGPLRSAAAITLVASGRRDASVVGLHVRGELRWGWLRAALSFPCPRTVQTLQPAPRLPAFAGRPLRRNSQAPRERVVLAVDAGLLEDAPLHDPMLLGAGLALAEAALSLGAEVGLVRVRESIEMLCRARPGRSGLSNLERELRGVTCGRAPSDLGALVCWAEHNLGPADTLVVLTAPFAQREALFIAAAARAERSARLLLCGSFADALEGSCQAEDPYERQAAHDMLAERREVRRAWVRSGIDWVDVPRQRLAVCLLRRYLDRRPLCRRGRQR